MQYNQITGLAKSLEENISRVIVGKEKQIQLLLTAFLSGGHVLLEDVPGTGKTTLAKALARSLSCKFSRVQFTPDLLPADITGMRIFDHKSGSFTFLPGPAFTNILLADEINRATPRTQSALLECMEERQITEGGTTYPLSEPFLGYPTEEESLLLMERFLNNQPLAQLEPVADADQICQAAKLCGTCRIDPDIMRYMAAFCEAARNPEKVRLGPSPRALLAWMRCCQALAAIRGRDYVIPDDAKELAVPVLAHRIILRGVHYQVTAQQFIQELLNSVSVPTESAS